MAKMFGSYAREGRIIPRVATSGTTAIDSGARLLEDYNGISFQLVTEDITHDVVVGASDTSVVASTKTFTIPGFDFTGKVGATINISGDVAHVGNNGNFVVSSVTSAHVVVATTASGLADETFDPATTTITVTDPTMAGDWTIEVSNDYSAGFQNDRAFDGTWTDVTAAFVTAAGDPAIAPVTTASNQATQAAPFMFRAYRVTFTPASGFGNVYCVAFAKAYA